jgi:hypothetical protein
VLRGEILSFDPVDGLGVIELEDGRQVRFSMRHLQLAGAPLPGKAVIVDDIEPGYAGQLRATVVREAAEAQSHEERFEVLLAAPATRAYELMEYRELSLESRRRFGPALLEWAKTHDLERYTRYDFVQHLPPELWSDEDAAGLEQHRAALQEQYEQSLRRQAPNLEHVEAGFATKLPAQLRDAWSSGGDDRLLAVTAEELTVIAQLICSEHAYALRPVDGKPFALLPFARGREDSDYYVLDLAWPTDDGDFAVRLTQHDVVDAIDVVAQSSAAWLAER